MTSITTLDQWIAEQFNNNFGLGGSFSWGNLILCSIAILLSVLLCGMIGLEREKRGRSAGLRTHLLVGAGSCVVMIISIYGFPNNGSNRDVARLAAQVVTGVGFLGAGAIIHNNGGIKGLTTASTIWIAMAIGLACGSMNFILAVGGTIIVMIVLIYFRKIERRVNRTNPMLIVHAESEVPVMTILLKVTKDFGYNISDVATQMVKNGNEYFVELTFKLFTDGKEDIDVDGFVKALESSGSIKLVQVLNHH